MIQYVEAMFNYMGHSYLPGGDFMIELTRLNDSTIMINGDLIESVEETPDTVVTLTTGKKYVVKESRQEVKNLVISYKQNIIKF